MEILRIISELPNNPRMINSLETEINRLVAFPNCNPLVEMCKSNDSVVHFYICKILELRIQSKIKTLNLHEEIQFATEYARQNQTDKMCQIYALLGLYCWPTVMPTFYNFILTKLDAKQGYKILLEFLEAINYSTDISAERRQELKKAVQIVSPEFLCQFKDEFAGIIIPIFKELLKIIPKTFDYSIVYNKANEFPYQAIEFFSEGIGSVQQNRLLEILPTFPVDPAMVHLLTSMKFVTPSGASKPTQISGNASNCAFNYVFKALIENEECFVPALQFWTRIFSTNGNDGMIIPVITECIRVYSKIDTSDDNEFEQKNIDSYYTFFTVVSKNYPGIIAKFLTEHGKTLEVDHSRLISFIIHKLSKASNGKMLLSGLMFGSVYLQCLTSFLMRDSNTPMYLEQLDFSDKESVKLALEILGFYKFTNEQLRRIYSKASMAAHSADEIEAFIHSRLGIHESFEGKWDEEKVIKYYYYLKINPQEYSVYKNDFYALFMENAPFDRCFFVLQRLGDVPVPILKHIYDNLCKWSYDQIASFNTDLLSYLPVENIVPFVELEVNKFVNDWLEIEDYKEYYSSMRSLFNVFSSKGCSLPLLQSYLIHMVQIDCPMMLNRILQFFIEGSDNFDTFNATQNLIIAYNLPNIIESQAMISAALTKCLAKPDGPKAFHEILGIDIDKCQSIHGQIVNSNRKSSQTIVRNLIKTFKAKSLSRQFENTLKVSQQNFLPQKDGGDKFNMPKLD